MLQQHWQCLPAGLRGRQPTKARPCKALAALGAVFDLPLISLAAPDTMRLLLALAIAAVLTAAALFSRLSGGGSGRRPGQAHNPLELWGTTNVRLEAAPDANGPPNGPHISCNVTSFAGQHAWVEVVWSGVPGGAQAVGGWQMAWPACECVSQRGAHWGKPAARFNARPCRMPCAAANALVLRSSTGGDHNDVFLPSPKLNPPAAQSTATINCH